MIEESKKQKHSLVIGCETVGKVGHFRNGGILVALADDDFNAEYNDFVENGYCHIHNPRMSDWDSKIWNCFEFGEYEDIQKPGDLIGKSICIHDGDPMEEEDRIVTINFIETVEEYFGYKKEQD